MSETSGVIPSEGGGNGVSRAFARGKREVPLLCALGIEHWRDAAYLIIA